MLNKSIGSLHSVPAPSAAVLGESLKLLSTFGDKKAISALLEQVREVQSHNERVFRDAQDAIGALIATRNELDERRNAFAAAKAQEDTALQRRATELSQAEARLSGKISAFADEQSLAKKALSEKERALEEREQAIAKRESECKYTEKELAERIAGQDKNERELSARFAKLLDKERKLRAALDGG